MQVMQSEKFDTTSHIVQPGEYNGPRQDVNYYPSDKPCIKHGLYFREYYIMYTTTIIIIIITCVKTRVYSREHLHSLLSGNMKGIAVTVRQPTTHMHTQTRTHICFRFPCLFDSYEANVNDNKEIVFSRQKCNQGLKHFFLQREPTLVMLHESKLNTGRNKKHRTLCFVAGPYGTHRWIYIMRISAYFSSSSSTIIFIPK